ncbi:hypothetical protein ACFQS1_11870 [Paractinoplanes rhizophilus]|uniref:Uncharacterized protein n=1 Tax=Paractinoplanes rhizophilus TaxID=1416877 RepID=A0ABW2HQL5_9ACTN
MIASRRRREEITHAPTATIASKISERWPGWGAEPRDFDLHLRAPQTAPTPALGGAE